MSVSRCLMCDREQHPEVNTLQVKASKDKQTAVVTLCENCIDRLNAMNTCEREMLALLVHKCPSNAQLARDGGLK